MSEHMRKHRIKPSSYSVKKIGSKKSSPWRDLFKEEIARYTEVGLMVRGGRAKAGLTQRELASLLHLPLYHIYQMEYGKRPIDKKIAQKLGKFFNVSYEVFLLSACPLEAIAEVKS